jgi:hypothetical protein
MRTNATSILTVVVDLDQRERFNYTRPSTRFEPGPHDTYVIEQIAYSGGHNSFVGRKVLRLGNLAKRTTLLNNIRTEDVPQEIRSTIMGAVRAHIGEQAKAVGILR